MLRRRVTAVAVACLLAAAGCTHHTRSSAALTTSTTAPGSSTTPSSTSPSTPTSIDVTKIPAAIDIGYASAVISAINHIHGEAARQLYQTGRVTARVKDLLAAIYVDPELQTELHNFEEDIATGVRKTYAGIPGDPSTSVHSVLSSSAKCIVVSATTDLSPFFAKAVTPLTGAVIQLGLKRPPADPGNLNPTTWIVQADGVPDAGTDLSRVCAG